MKKVLSLLLTLVMLSSVSLSLSSCFSDKVEMVDINLTTENYAIAVGKDNGELLSSVNSTLNEIKKNGTLDGILNKYFNDDEDNYKKIPTGTLNPLKEQLVVATHTQFHPFEFSKYESGKGKLYSGIDIEIVSIIAEALDLELVIREYDFDELFDAVSSGEADIAVAGITVNAQRQEKVNFSDSYFTSSQVLIVKSDDKTFDDCSSKADVENILKELDKNTVVGCQSDTTGQNYLGNFNITPQGYASAILATQALINGDVSFVIIDKEHAKQIVKNING